MTEASASRVSFCAVVGLTLLAAALIFPRLGQRYLWEDEAVTALLAQNTLRFGVPTNWDGRNLISFAQMSANAEFLEARTSWLPYYVLAGVYAVLGQHSQQSTFVARLPFALAAIACVPVVYLLVRRMAGTRKLAGLSAGVLAVSVNLLLYARQCRYYSLAMLLTLLVLWGYAMLDERPRRGVLLCGLAGGLLFHTQYVAYLTVMVSLGAVIVLLDRRWARVRNFLVALGVSAALALPWVLCVGAYPLPSMGVGERVKNAVVIFAWYLRDYHALGMMPFLLLPALFLAVARRDAGRWRLDRPLACLLIVIVATTGLVSVFTPQRYEQTWHADVRFAIHLLPLFAVLSAAALLWLWRWRRWMAVAAALLLVWTNLLSWFPFQLGSVRAWRGGPRLVKDAWGYQVGPRGAGDFWDRLRFPLPSYLYEITHDRIDPQQAAAEFLARSQDVRPGDLVMTLPTAVGESLRFYNPGLRLCRRWRPEWGARPTWYDTLPPYVSEPTAGLRWVIDFETALREALPAELRERLARRQSGAEALYQRHRIEDVKHRVGPVWRGAQVEEIPLGVANRQAQKPDQHNHGYFTFQPYPPEWETYVYRCVPLATGLP